MLVLFTFLTIYNPPILTFSFLHITTLISFFDYLRYSKLYRRDFGNKIKKLWLGILCIQAYLFIIIFANDKNYVDPIYRIAAINIEMIPSACFIAFHVKRQKKDIIDIIIKAATIEAIVCVFTLLSSPFHEFIVGLMVSHGYSESYSMFVNYRLYGISYSMMFGMPILNSVLAVIALYKAITHNYQYLISTILLILSAVVNARISILMLIISLTFFIMIVLGDRFLRVKKFIMLIPIAFAIGIVAWFFKDLIGGQYEMTIKWIEKGFTDMVAIIFAEDNGGVYYSYYRGTDKWQLPQDVFQCVFGTGQRVIRNNSLYSSDIGYINDIWLGGFVYAISLYLLFGNYILDLGKIIQRKTGIKLIGVALIVILAVANIKGSVIGNNEFIAFIILITCYCFSKPKANL